MFLLVLLSLGAIYAIIPIIIIVILLLAAMGARGGSDLFAFFGIDTLFGLRGTYAKQGRIGLSGGRYATSGKAAVAGGGVAGRGGIAAALGRQGKNQGLNTSKSSVAKLFNERRALKLTNEKRLGELSSDQLAATAKHFGMDDLGAASGSAAGLSLFITSAANPTQLKKYLDQTYNTQKAAEAPLQPPTERMTWNQALGKYVKSDFKNWQKSFRSTRKARMKKTYEDSKKPQPPAA
jgi:hypothetical protein